MTRRKLARAIVEHTTRTVSEAMAGRVAQASVVTSPFADTSEELTVQFEGSSVAVPVKGIRTIPVFPGMKVLMVNIHSDWVCIGPYSNPSVGTGATRIAIGADVPQELRDSHDIETVMLFYAVDFDTGLEKGYFFKGVSNKFNQDSPTLIEGEVLYPTLGDPSSPTTANVKPNRQSIMMGNLIPVDQFFNVHIASIGGFYLQSGAGFGVIDGLTGTSAQVLSITKSAGVVTVELSSGAVLSVPYARTVTGLVQGIVRRKSADTVHNNTTTMVNDADLRVTGLPANSVWKLTSWVPYTGVSENSDIKFDLSLPSGATKTWSGIGGSTAVTTNITAVTMGHLSGQLTRGTINGVLSILITGTVSIGGTAGDLILQHAPANAVAENLTVHAGAYLELARAS